LISLDSDPKTIENKRQWDRKPVLRAIYHDLYQRIVSAQRPGLTLEIGGGSGIFKLFEPSIVSMDIRPVPGLDFVADAQRLPLATGTVDNIVLFDVLHHIEFPALFFAEADRVLQPRGRVIMIEPAVTWASWPVYRFIHEEAVALDQDPLAEGIPDPARAPFDANIALPTLLFGRDRSRFQGRFKNMRVLRLDWLSCFAYPLSGGFQPWSLIPSAILRPVLWIEDRLPQFIRRRLAYRLFAVIEKVQAD